MIRRPPRSTLFPTRRSSDLPMADVGVDLFGALGQQGVGGVHQGAARVHDVVDQDAGDRKSTRLNSSHMSISYAVFCLKKKKKIKITTYTQTKCNRNQESSSR